MSFQHLLLSCIEHRPDSAHPSGFTATAVSPSIARPIGTISTTVLPAQGHHLDGNTLCQKNCPVPHVLDSSRGPEMSSAVHPSALIIPSRQIDNPFHRVLQYFPVLGPRAAPGLHSKVPLVPAQSDGIPSLRKLLHNWCHSPSSISSTLKSALRPRVRPLVCLPFQLVNHLWTFVHGLWSVPGYIGLRVPASAGTHQDVSLHVVAGPGGVCPIWSCPPVILVWGSNTDQDLAFCCMFTLSGKYFPFSHLSQTVPSKCLHGL